MEVNDTKFNEAYHCPVYIVGKLQDMERRLRDLQDQANDLAFDIHGIIKGVIEYREKLAEAIEVHGEKGE